MTDDDVTPGSARPESRFFWPTSRCPHPERWTSTDGDSTEVEVSELVAALVRATQPDLVVETGSAFGQTTQMIRYALAKNGRGRLVTLEPNPERVAYVRRLLTEAVKHVEVVEMSSLHWWPDGPIDLLFSDSLRDIRVDEILRYLPWMRAGATVVVHDSAWDVGPLRGWIENSLVTPGLVRAIDLPTPRGVTVCEVLVDGARVS